MSKPPFIISNRSGAELWPNTIQSMPVMRMELYGKGLTAQEIAYAEQVARRLLQEVSGQLKQYFLRQRSVSDAGVSKFASHHMQLTSVISVRYVRNMSQEFLLVRVDAQQIINEEMARQKAQAGPPKQNCIVWIFYNWSGGLDLDTMTRVSVPPVSAYVGYAGDRGGNGGGIFTGVYVDGEPTLFWYSGDNTTERGPEIVMVNTIPIVKSGATRITVDMNANWYAERGGAVSITVQYYTAPIAEITWGSIPERASPGTIQRIMQSHGWTLAQTDAMSVSVSVQSYAVEVQRVGRAEITVLSPTYDPLNPDASDKPQFEFHTVHGSGSVFSP